MAKVKKSRSRARKAKAPCPASMPVGGGDQESLAESLIEKLGFYEEFPGGHDEQGNDAKGDVESE